MLSVAWMNELVFLYQWNLGENSTHLLLTDERTEVQGKLSFVTTKLGHNTGLSDRIFLVNESKLAQPDFFQSWATRQTEGQSITFSQGWRESHYRDKGHSWWNATSPSWTGLTWTRHRNRAAMSSLGKYLPILIGSQVIFCSSWKSQPYDHSAEGSSPAVYWSSPLEFLRSSMKTAFTVKQIWVWIPFLIKNLHYSSDSPLCTLGTFSVIWR